MRRIAAASCARHPFLKANPGHRQCRNLCLGRSPGYPGGKVGFERSLLPIYSDDTV